MLAFYSTWLGNTDLTMKSICNCIKTQLCTLAVSLTLFNTARLPREAFKYGAVPYLVVYTFWLLAVGLPTCLLQLAMGQLSQQDPIGVWRAVPFLRGVGHLKVLTSYLCCVYNIMYIALSLAFFIWIAKGSLPLRDCTRLHITHHGYENKMSAAECFNSTFLSSFTDNPQYFGIMSILMFFLWFFVPLLLYRLQKSLKASLAVLAPVTIVLAVVLCVFLSDVESLKPLFESCMKWVPITHPRIWHSALIQALLSTHIAGGFLVSAGGKIYVNSDVRWTTTSVIVTNILSGWIWILVWESILGEAKTDTSFISILVLIYQSNIGRRMREWPMLAFGLVVVSGMITVLTLLFPIYDKIQRVSSINWRLFAASTSAVGTVLSVAVLAKGLEVATLLDDLVIPVLAVFTTAVEIVGLVFIYGWYNLSVDIEFLTGCKLPCIWTAIWWTIPVFLLSVTGWWLRAILRITWSQNQSMWPLLGVFIGIIVVMVVVAAIAVAKEEQYNFVAKVASAFRSSRLWGPEEPMARYIWMSKRYAADAQYSDDTNSDPINYSEMVYNRDNEKKYDNEWTKINEAYQRNFFYNTNNDILPTKHMGYKEPGIYTTYSVPRGKRKKKDDEKFRSPNICVAKDQLGGSSNCNCNRHFQLKVPDLRKTEITTSL
ncbi:sodium-dependent nutrient amino acid transporter 1 isoform X2 [Amyelois transitella]|uniref:sodium-dependent nutrient amino acid transporter 1 isoform X2 n=1 Tax=Amyelois transitella TaxID=680683 RepID=UPI00298FF648|nr:sodium-dependent nutrient amino acid transporter 1 isoform X2 [Amyelois transitella]